MQPFGDRSKVVIEPMLTDQWFVDTAKIVEPALEAVRSGKTKIMPESGEKTYFHWLENIEPWCISAANCGGVIRFRCGMGLKFPSRASSSMASPNVFAQVALKRLVSPHFLITLRAHTGPKMLQNTTKQKIAFSRMTRGKN